MDHRTLLGGFGETALAEKILGGAALPTPPRIGKRPVIF